MDTEIFSWKTEMIYVLSKQGAWSWSLWDNLTIHTTGSNSLNSVRDWWFEPDINRITKTNGWTDWDGWLDGWMAVPYWQLSNFATNNGLLQGRQIYYFQSSVRYSPSYFKMMRIA